MRVRGKFGLTPRDPGLGWAGETSALWRFTGPTGDAAGAVLGALGVRGSCAREGRSG